MRHVVRREAGHGAASKIKKGGDVAKLPRQDGFRGGSGHSCVVAAQGRGDPEETARVVLLARWGDAMEMEVAQARRAASSPALLDADRLYMAILATYTERLLKGLHAFCAEKREHGITELPPLDPFLERNFQ